MLALIYVGQYDALHVLGSRKEVEIAVFFCMYNNNDHNNNNYDEYLWILEMVTVTLVTFCCCCWPECTGGCLDFCTDSCRFLGDNDCTQAIATTQPANCTCRKCPSGYFMDSIGTCVQKESCPCYVNGTEFPVGHNMTYPGQCRFW